MQDNNNGYEYRDGYGQGNNNAYSPNGNGCDQQNNNSYSSNGNAQNSSYYTPPYYTPNYSSSGNGYPQPPKRKFPKVAVAIIAIVVVSVLLVVCLSLLTTFISKLEYANSSSDAKLDADGEDLYIVQNSPNIEISKNTDVDYVPQSIPEVVQKIGDSVVEISTSSVVNDRFFHQYVTSGAGSGVIITQSKDAGYLLTNHHVIDGATEITVRLTNAQEYKAQLLGSDANLDLAVLRIEKKSSETFTAAPIGDSGKLLVGQDVIAIGNPLGSLGGTVTNGIISALDRTVTIDNVSMVLLQHNAAINPGNSGGGLFDGMGNLIGIVNAKTSETGIEGLGFAIPINIAYRYFNRVMVIEPAIGAKVTYGRYNNLVGVYVTSLTDENTKFQKYDRVTAVNGKTVETDVDYYNAIESLSVGDTVTITVKRDYSTVDIKITI